MKLDELKQLIREGESETLEFKRSTAKLQSAAKTLCAFLNGKGGIVLIGVSDVKKLIGQHVTDTTRQEIAQALRKFEPTANIELQYVDNEPGKQIIVLTAHPDDRSVPYTYEGRAYERKESSTSVMPQNRYQQLLLAKNFQPFSWEMQPALQMSIEDLDQTEILNTAKDIARKKRLEAAFDTKDVSEILKRLQLIQASGQITQAAVVLFAKEISGDYMHCVLKMARFKGVDKDKDRLIDSKQVTGNAFKLLKEAEVFINRNTAIASHFEPGNMARIDIPEYPFESVREALINGICHRSYTSSGGSITITIYDDRLEIASAGLLPQGITISDLKTTHTSHPRNATITNVFFRRGFVESLGIGTQEIIKPYADTHQKEPEFLEHAGYFIVRLWSRHYAATEKGVKLSDKQKDIMTLIKKGEITANELQENLDIPERTLRRELAKLKALGLVTERKEGKIKFWYAS